MQIHCERKKSKYVNDDCEISSDDSSKDASNESDKSDYTDEEASNEDTDK